MQLAEKKSKAQKLRQQGISIKEIAKIVSISRSTASVWCREIVLSEKQRKILKQKQTEAGSKGRSIGTTLNKKQKEDSLLDATSKSKKLITHISKKELLLIATALYWAEGSKSKKTTGFQFINSDPQMILCMKKFLLEHNIKKEDITYSLQINMVHKSRITQVLNFWENLLQLENGQIKGPYFVNTQSKKIYNNHDTYYGICRLIVKKSTKLKYLTLALIEDMKQNILSV